MEQHISESIYIYKSSFQKTGYLQQSKKKKNPRKIMKCWQKNVLGSFGDEDERNFPPFKSSKKDLISKTVGEDVTSRFIRYSL